MRGRGRLTVRSPQATREIELGPADEARDVAELLRRADCPLNTRCQGQGLCQGCLIELVAGSLVEKVSGKAILATECRLPVRACQCRVPAGGWAEIRIPARSLLAHEPQIVSSFRCNVPRAHEPLWQVLRQPTGDLDRTIQLAEALCLAVARRLDEPLPVRAESAPQQADPSLAGDLLLAMEYRGDHWSLRIMDRDPQLPALGLAVDVGTTTVAALLVDLANGDVAASAAAVNAQIYLGDNVVTRIKLCLDDQAKLRELQEAVIRGTLLPLIEQLLAQAGARAEQVVCCSIAGNTTMLHLLAGVDPGPMGAAPFTPQFLDHRMLRFGELPVGKAFDREERRGEKPAVGGLSGRFADSLRDQALAAGPPVTRKTEAAGGMQEAAGGGGPASPLGGAFGVDSLVHLLPGAAAYIGADITAGIFSSGMGYRPETSLLVDIGTNGEIVLKHKGQLIGCATAAGPAFEGAGLACGVRAGKGAISHVYLDGDPPSLRLEIIGRGKPIGLCGTAYVDFVSQARRHGLIGRTGRMTENGAASNLACQTQRGRAFLIAQPRGREPIIVSEADIASLLQAKAAIAAGVVCLLRRFGLAAHDVRTLYLAGGFGFHMDVDSLLGCGLLPGFAASQIQVVGNSSLAGAYLALLDAGCLEEIKRISRQLEVVELNLEPDFTSCYVDQLWLP